MDEAEKKRRESEDLWAGVQFEHNTPKEDSFLTRFAILIFLTLCGSGIGAVAGIFLNPGPRHNSMERLMNDTPEKMKVRVIIGAILGGLIVAGFVGKALFFRKD